MKLRIKNEELRRENQFAGNGSPSEVVGSGKACAGGSRGLSPLLALLNANRNVRLANRIQNAKLGGFLNEERTRRMAQDDFRGVNGRLVLAGGRIRSVKRGLKGVWWMVRHRISDSRGYVSLTQKVVAL